MTPGRHRSRISALRSPHARGGATLTEVLMSLLIMSIGIVSVIAIFPISLLRSIQANQLTNARLMRKNVAEELRLSFSETYTPAPGYNFRYDILNQSTLLTGTATSDVDQQIFRGYWEPGTLYYAGQVVMPTSRDITAGTRSNRWYQFLAPVGTTGVSGSVEPNWASGATINDPPTGGTPVAWTAVDSVPLIGGLPTQGMPFPPTGQTYDALNYVVDPLGWNVLSNDATNAFTVPADLLQNEFGYDVNDGIAGRLTLPTGARRLLRINGGAYTIGQGEFLAAHPDSWSVSVTDTPLSWVLAPPVPTPESVTLAAADLSNIDVNGASRIVLTSLSSPVAIVRPIIPGSVNVGTRTVSWNERLPAGFTPDGPARIEVKDRRFTWLATVNKDFSGHAKVTVAVFFKRSFSVADEHAYVATLASGALMSDQILVDFSTAGVPEPLIKEGNYLFDAINCQWYRMVNVDKGTTDATITVDRPIPFAQRTAVGDGRVILMRGIVELFEL